MPLTRGDEHLHRAITAIRWESAMRNAFPAFSGLVLLVAALASTDVQAADARLSSHAAEPIHAVQPPSVSNSPATTSPYSAPNASGPSQPTMTPASQVQATTATQAGAIRNSTRQLDIVAMQKIEIQKLKAVAQHLSELIAEQKQDKPFCSSTVISANSAGKTRDCSPYICDVDTGLCRTSCESSADCMANGAATSCNVGGGQPGTPPNSCFYVVNTNHDSAP